MNVNFTMMQRHMYSSPNFVTGTPGHAFNSACRMFDFDSTVVEALEAHHIWTAYPQVQFHLPSLLEAVR